MPDVDPVIARISPVLAEAFKDDDLLRDFFSEIAVHTHSKHDGTTIEDTTTMNLPINIPNATLEYLDTSGCAVGMCGAVYLEVRKMTTDPEDKRVVKSLKALNYSHPGQDACLLSTDGPYATAEEPDFKNIMAFVRRCGDRLHKMNERRLRKKEPVIETVTI